MAEYGGFEPETLLHRGALAEVWAGRVPGGGGGAEGKVAIKIYRPPVGIIGREAADAGVKAFGESVEIQRRAAASPQPGARHWLGVRAAGRIESGSEGEDGVVDAPERAYVVTELAERGSVGRLICGAATIDGAVLANVTGSVLGALRAVEADQRRGHGDLRASNILMVDDAAPSVCRVVLCDPAAGSEAAGPDRGGDLRRLGEIVFGLVVRREYGGAWPVALSPSWQHLGPRGEEWLGLTNALLDPRGAGGAGAYSAKLQELAGTVERLSAASMAAPARRKRVLVAGGLALAGVVAVGVILGRGGSGGAGAEQEVRWVQEPAAAERWRRLCDDYYNWLWTLRDLGQRPAVSGKGLPSETRRELYAAVSPELLEALKPFVEAGSHPGSIAGLGAAEPDFRALGIAPSAAARSDGGVGKTERLSAQVEELREFLTQRWSVMRGLDGAAADWSARGWAGPAAAAEAIAQRVREAVAQGSQVSAAVDRAAVEGNRVAGLAARVRAIAAAAEGMKAAGDPVLERMEGAVNRAVAEGLAAEAKAASDEVALAALESELTRVEGTVARVERFVAGEWKNIDAGELRRSAEYAALAADERPGLARMEEWMALAARYPALPPEENPAPAVAAAWEVLRGVVREYDEAIGGKQPLEPGVRAAVEKIGERVDRLGRLGWVARNRGEIERQSAELGREITGVKAGIESRLSEYRREAARSREEVVQQARAERSIVPGSEAIDAEWRRRRDEALARLGGAEKDEIVAAMTGLRAGLRELDAQTPRALDEGGGGGAGARLAAVTRQRREQLVGRAAAEMSAEEMSSAAAIAGKVAAPAREYGAWVEQVRGLREKVDRVDRHLRGGYGLEEPIADGDGRTAAAVWAECAASALMSEGEIGAAVETMKSRIERLAAMAGERDGRALITAVEGAGPEDVDVALAAWSRMRSEEVGWPRNMQEVEAGRGVRAAVELRIRSGAVEGRREELLRRVAGEFAAAWSRYAAAAMSAATDAAGKQRAAREVVAALEPMGVKDDEIASGRMRYNAAVARLETGLKNDDDAATAGAVARFVEAARGLPPEVRGSERVSALVTAIEPLARDRAGQAAAVDPLKLGPGGKAIAGRSEDSGRLLVFEVDGVPVRFVRVEFQRAGGGEDVSYVGECEVSIALFEKLLSRGGIARERFLERVGIDPSDDGWTGPRAWEWRAGRTLRPSQYWVTSRPQYLSTAPAHAEGIAATEPGARERGVAAAAGGNPRASLPMHRISAEMARAAAGAIGCRVPTVEEWRAARGQVGTAAESSWNLRDRTFAKQYAHVDEVMKRGGMGFADPYPKPDAFSYAPSAGGVAAREFDDGVMWFRDADAGEQVFRNLIGNVAEYVAAGNERVLIIGGSALSDSAVAVDQAVEAQTAYTPADVGLRLAFSATGSRLTQPPLARQVAERLGDAPMLVE